MKRRSIIKKGSSWKVLAVEDGSFKIEDRSSKRGKAFLVGVILDGSRFKDILLTCITVDGMDATRSLITLVKRKAKLLDVILLASIAYAGFNLMNPKELYRQLQVPVIIANSRKPDNRAVVSAIRLHFPDWQSRLAVLYEAGSPCELALDKSRKLYFCSYGITATKTAKMLRTLTLFGNRPEPLRVARLIARGLGRA